MLAELMGLEKFRGMLPLVGEPIELPDAVRPWDCRYGDMGECGTDTPLLEESFLDCEKVEPAFELV